MVLLGQSYFLHRGSHNAVLWIFNENNGDKKFVVLAVAEQHLHKAKDFSASHADLSVRSLGVHQELGGDTARTADPKWTKVISHTIWRHAH